MAKVIKDNKVVGYYGADFTVQVDDYFTITKEEYKKNKRDGEFCFKLRGREKIKDFALQLLFDLGYMVRLS